MPTDADYTINDLSRLTGLNVRTIRYWLAQGLLPASGESGPGAHYGQGHLDRLRLIKRLQGEYLPNAEIRRRLAPLSDAEVAGLIAGLIAEPAQPDPERPTTTALEYVRGLLGGSRPNPGPSPMPIPGAPPSGSALHAPAPNASAPSAPDAVAQESMPIAAYPARLRLGAPRLATKPVVPSMPALRDSAGDSAPDTYAAIGIGNAETAPATAPATAAATASAAAAATNTSPQPERSQWERLSLGDNIELHIRRPLSRPEQRRVERLITIARQVLEED